MIFDECLILTYLSIQEDVNNWIPAARAKSVYHKSNIISKIGKL